MDCFICRNPARPHVVCGLRSRKGPASWAHICVSCSIKYELDGQLCAGPNDAEAAERWVAHWTRKRSGR